MTHKIPTLTLFTLQYKSERNFMSISRRDTSKGEENEERERE